MPDLVDRRLCTGCATCKAVCPRHAIEMVADDEGFLRPHVDVSRCVGCGLCGKCCPPSGPLNDRRPIGVYAAKTTDGELRLESSSGGIFSLLAEDVLSRGGVVFGAAFDRSGWRVVHRMVEDMAGLAELRGAKYVQSDMGDCHKQVRAALEDGRDVLFSGTPCQCAGVKSYLSLCDRSASAGGLLLVEVVCRAVPSPLAWRKYLECRVRDACGGMAGLGEIGQVSLRRKDRGWKNYALSLDFADGKTYLAVFKEDPFMRGFLSGLYNRPSCHECNFRNLRSGSDVSIGDYWGIETKFPEMDDDKGVSLVLVDTEAGRAALSRVADRLEMRASDFAHVVAANPAIVESAVPHRNRGSFFRRVMVQGFDTLVERMLKPAFKGRLRSFVGRALRKTGLRK